MFIRAACRMICAIGASTRPQHSWIWFRVNTIGSNMLQVRMTGGCRAPVVVRVTGGWTCLQTRQPAPSLRNRA